MQVSSVLLILLSLSVASHSSGLSPGTSLPHLKNFREIFEGLSVSTGTPPDKELHQLFSDVQQQLPKFGKATEYTSTAQTAVLSLSAAYCEKMIVRDSKENNPSLRWAHSMIDF